MDTPKELDALNVIKAELKRSTRRLLDQAKSVKELYEEEDIKEVISHAHSAVQDAAHVISEASELLALRYVVDGTYMDPKACAPKKCFCGDIEGYHGCDICRKDDGNNGHDDCSDCSEIGTGLECRWEPNGDES